MTASSSPSSCHSNMPEKGRASINIKTDFSRASLTSLASAAKRKRLSSLTAAHSSTAAPSIDGTMFDLATPRRRFKRRNSKCASMFYQVISPTTLLELQRLAGETQEPGFEATVPSLQEKRRSLLGTRRPWGAAGASTEEDEEGNRWSCTQLRSHMPATSSCPCPAFPSSTTPSSTCTHSILAEALRLSSDHLDMMASALLVHKGGENSIEGDEDDDDVSL